MNHSSPSDFASRAGILKALAHPTRLFIVDSLSRGELCVRDLTRKVGADISTVSKHLSILKAAGILQDRKAGLQVFYSLRCTCVMGFFRCVEGVAAADRKLARR